MRGRGDRPFRQDELLGSDGTISDPADLAAAMAVAGALEQVAEEPSPRPSPDFLDRVIKAIANEPAPAPGLAARDSLRRGSPFGFLAALRDAGRVAFGAGRPVAIRAQAFALVLVVAVGVISLSGATALAAGRLIAPAPATTHVPVTAAPSISPTRTNSESPGAQAFGRTPRRSRPSR